MADALSRIDGLSLLQMGIRYVNATLWSKIQEAELVWNLWKSLIYMFVLCIDFFHLEYICFYC